LKALTSSSSSSYFNGDCLFEAPRVDDPSLDGDENSLFWDLERISLVTSLLLLGEA
jgi:hypothetical protein